MSEEIPQPQICLIGGFGTPKYVKQVTLINKTGVELSGEAIFQSEEKYQFTIGNDPQVIKLGVDLGDHVQDFAILEININVGQEQLININCNDAQSIETRTYVIYENKTLERVA